MVNENNLLNIVEMALSDMELVMRATPSLNKDDVALLEATCSWLRERRKQEIDMENARREVTN